MLCSSQWGHTPTCRRACARCSRCWCTSTSSWGVGCPLPAFARTCACSMMSQMVTSSSVESTVDNGQACTASETPGSLKLDVGAQPVAVVNKFLVSLDLQRSLCMPLPDSIYDPQSMWTLSQHGCHPVHCICMACSSRHAFQHRLCNINALEQLMVHLEMISQLEHKADKLAADCSVYQSRQF